MGGWRPAGTGKSVASREMLLSMLCTNTPEHLRLIIVDTKIVEYADFDGIPHLCQPICAGVDSAMRSLAWLASEIGKIQLNKLKKQTPSMFLRRKAEQVGLRI